MNTFLYYDDRPASFNGMEFPLCSFVAILVSNLYSVYPNLNVMAKINTKDILGVNYGNYTPLEMLGLNQSGFNQDSLLLIKGVSIPKYVIPEYIVGGSGFSPEIDKMHIFDLLDVVSGADYSDMCKEFPTITREEFFDLLK